MSAPAEQLQTGPTIRDLMTDADLFGDQFGGASWAAWRALLAGFYCLPMDDGEQELFQRITSLPDSLQDAFGELWLVIGRRGGKSQIAALLAVFEAAFHDYTGRLAPGEVATVMVLACDRKQARTVMRYISGLLRSNPMLERMIRREERESIELTNRTVIEVSTASFRSVRGYTVAAVIADEIAFWRSEESANPDFEIINALRPAMATLEGKLIALSSPYSRRGALWSTYQRNFGKPGPILVAQAPSQTMNPSLPSRVIEEAMDRDPATARAEYMAEFRTDLEQFVRIEQVQKLIEPGRIERAPVPGLRYTAFVDPSGGSQDSFTLAIAHKERSRGGSETTYLDCTREVRPPFSPERVVTEFCELLRRYRIRKIYGDRYAGEWVSEQFRKHGISYCHSEHPKSNLYRDALALFNSEQVEILDDDRLVKQLVSLERRTGRGGRDSIDHPPGGHDDLANAVCGVLTHCTTYIKSFAVGRVPCV